MLVSEMKKVYIIGNTTISAMSSREGAETR